MRWSHPKNGVLCRQSHSASPGQSLTPNQDVEPTRRSPRLMPAFGILLTEKCNGK
jgi:hypothetical protein